MRAKITSPMALMATENRRDRKNANSNIGWVDRRSQSTNPVNTATEPLSAPSTSPDVHERLGASMIPQSSSVMPTIDRAAPTGSGRLLDGSFELGTSQPAANSPATAIGTLTKKTDPHQ